MRNSLAARTLISTPRAGASLTKASIERTTPLICGSQASVMMRMRVNGNAGTVMLGRIWTREIARGLATCSPGHAPHHGEDIQSFSSSFTRLGGRISELSRSGDLNLLAVHWLAGLGEPRLRCVILNGRPVAGAGRREALQHAVHNPLRLRPAYAMRLCDFRDEFGCVHLASSKTPSPREVLIFTGGNY